jgi:hypothetical protein
MGGMNPATTSGPAARPPLVATLLGIEGGLLAALGVALLADGVWWPGLGCLLAAAVAAGLATSIVEGLPDVRSTVLGFEGALAATGLAVVSAPAALAAALVTVAALVWARRHEARAQMRRPVVSQ